jgi:hypothetical protein
VPHAEEGLERQAERGEVNRVGFVSLCSVRYIYVRYISVRYISTLYNRTVMGKKSFYVTKTN